MILMVREGCDFCNGLGEIPGLAVFKVVRDENNQTKVKVGENLIDPPFKLEGLPSLLDMQDLFVGREPILEHLKEKGCLEG